MYRPDIRLRSSARSDRGRVRQNNEDSVHLWDAETSVLAIVADGMGGAVAGEEASRIAVETIQKTLATDLYRSPSDYNNHDSSELAEILGDAVQDANQNIINKATADPELKGMGTTITIAFARFNDVILAHVGDSRAYYVDSSSQTINQLTADHSFVQALVDAGHIEPHEADSHPMKNVLYRALGQAEDLDVDLLMDVSIHSGDRLVLCSDGLTLHVNSDEIRQAALATDDPNAIADKLVELANSRGGKDNVSVVVVTAEMADFDDDAVVMPESLEVGSASDEVQTIAMDPDYLNITRLDKSMESLDNTDDPNATQETPSAGVYGEGNDSIDLML